jgi:surface carbohydrate biosynthesis protein (TIGR04326 family)
MDRITLTSAGGRTLTRDLASFLSAELRDRARAEANRWIKSLRLAPFEGVPMRQRFTYRDDSLWWFTELYLHKMRRLDRAVTTVLALETACAEESPASLSLESDNLSVHRAAVAFAATRQLEIALHGSPTAPRVDNWRSLEIGLSARLSGLRGRLRPERKPRVAAFVHTAFWRRGADGSTESPQQESYIGEVLDAVAASAGREELFCVGVGPRRNFRSGWWDRVRASAPSQRLVTPIERLVPGDALAGSLDLWRRRTALAAQLTSGDGIRDAARYRGCDLWPVLEPELEGVARLQWPWSVRAMDEAGAALDALEPGVAVTYAEAGGWGRALMLEARRRRIPSIGLQHGFIYRHWLNYLHEPDELDPLDRDAGFPLPGVTLVFDGDAARHLRDAGRFPAGAIEVTGNPRLDRLAADFSRLQSERAVVRRELVGSDDRPIAVLAAKYSEIQHELPALVEAMRPLADARLVIKPHPAETSDVYAAVAAGTGNVIVTSPAVDLARTLVAADLLVTMNSTVAIDALVLGVPSLVVGLPNNLSPFVSAGAMTGAEGGDAIRERLRGLLYDPQVRSAAIAAGAAFARDRALMSDGQAARRTAAAILARATGPARHD